MSTYQFLCVWGRNRIFILAFEIFQKFSKNITNEEDHHSYQLEESERLQICLPVCRMIEVPWTEKGSFSSRGYWSSQRVSFSSIWDKGMQVYIIWSYKWATMSRSDPFANTFKFIWNSKALKKTMCPKKVLSKHLLNWICMMITANCIFNRIILWCLGKRSW